MGIKTIYMTGGEAFLRKDIFELIDYAARPGIITTVNTNGSFITDRFAKRIVSSKLSCINFSFDGATPKTHNAIRGDQVFEKAVKAIEYINYYKKILHRDNASSVKNGLNVVMTSVITKSNLDELPQLINLAESLHCCDICLQPLVDNGNLLETLSFRNEFWIQEEDLPRLQKAFCELEQIKEHRRLSMTVNFMPEKTMQHFKRQRVVNSCFAGFTRIFVNSRGDLSFVCFPSFGNTKTVSLRQAWFSEKAFATRGKLKSCTVNCTQFCSERSQSDAIQEIHQRFKQEIQSLQALDQELIIMQESSFLQFMSSLVASANIAANEKTQTLCDIEKILQVTRQIT
jgi:MoaA/NifB/PqqE/SkfB family radical SAM enzyme